MANTNVLPGCVLAASPYLAGFDRDSPLDAATAKARFAGGDRFCLRYLSLLGERSSDLTTAEAEVILAAGLALMPVQHVDAYGWSPTQTLGETHGRSAAANAQAVGFPPGVCVWVDVEGVSPGAAVADVVAYCLAWYAVVDAAGYVPGLYVGPNSGLTGAALTGLPFAHYWRSASRGLPEPERGFQLLQGLVRGGVDPDTTADDALGGQARWLALASPAYPTLSASAGPASTAVLCLQRALNAATQARLAEDGLFGAATRAAVAGFQASVGVPASGVADPATWSLLVGRPMS